MWESTFNFCLSHRIQSWHLRFSKECLVYAFHPMTISDKTRVLLYIKQSLTKGTAFDVQLGVQDFLLLLFLSLPLPSISFHAAPSHLSVRSSTLFGLTLLDTQFCMHWINYFLSHLSSRFHTGSWINLQSLVIGFLASCFECGCSCRDANNILLRRSGKAMVQAGWCGMEICSFT